MVVIDDDNWASADMWFHDFDGDGALDLVANQIFHSTVTRYRNPGDDLKDPWNSEVIISGLTSPSDMWLEDMDGDGLVDVVSADHTAHRGVWHKNPGPDSTELWQQATIFRNIRMPGDFALVDLDKDGDKDWVGTSMTWGQAFIVEQVEPESGLVVNISLPEDFDKEINKLVVLLTREVPMKGIPTAILANIDNVDKDGDGELDVDQILSLSHDLILSMEDVGEIGDFHVVVVLYVNGGGRFEPKSGVDYMVNSELVRFGEGPVEVSLEMDIAP